MHKIVIVSTFAVFVACNNVELPCYQTVITVSAVAVAVARISVPVSIDNVTCP